MFFVSDVPVTCCWNCEKIKDEMDGAYSRNRKARSRCKIFVTKVNVKQLCETSERLLEDLEEQGFEDLNWIE
jgi:hypothetical protein